jgi:AbrB family looped-hinge helix DNA binding protein
VRTARRMTMRAISSMTSKGQVTIPKEIRDELGLKPHDKVRFSIENGHAKFERLPSLEELVGSLSSLASLGLNMTVEEAIELAMEEHARDVVEKMRSE